MDQTMEMGKSAGMAQNPDMAKEKMMTMQKDKLKAMIDNMDEEHLTAMSAVMDKMNEPPDTENPESESDDTTLDWNEPRASADAKLTKLGY